MTATTQAPPTVPGSTAHTDGAWAVIPIQTRSERLTSTVPSDFGVPSGREVNWKHTPIDRLAALLGDEPGAADAPGLRPAAQRGNHAQAALVLGQMLDPPDHHAGAMLPQQGDFQLLA